jgi:hypothetical protein
MLNGSLPNRLPRPAISTNASGMGGHVLGEGLSTSPVGSFLGSAMTPTAPHANGYTNGYANGNGKLNAEPDHQRGEFDPSHSTPMLAPPSAGAPALSPRRSTPALSLSAPPSTPAPAAQEKITISPDNTLSYLPAETRWTILQMLQIEPQSRATMQDLLWLVPPMTPPLTPGRSDDGHAHGNGHANGHGLGEKQLPSGLQMTPARRSATTPVVPTSSRRRQEPSIQELGQDWLKGVVPCSRPVPGAAGKEGGEGCWDHVHVRLKTGGKEKSGGGKWWKKG